MNDLRRRDLLPPTAGPSFSSPGQLVKRKDFLVVDEEAQNHPNRFYSFFSVELLILSPKLIFLRTYYYRKHADVDEVISTCTKKIQVSNVNNKSHSCIILEFALSYCSSILVIPRRFFCEVLVYSRSENIVLQL